MLLPLLCFVKRTNFSCSSQTSTITMKLAHLRKTKDGNNGRAASRPSSRSDSTNKLRSLRLNRTPLSARVYIHITYAMHRYKYRLSDRWFRALGKGKNHQENQQASNALILAVASPLSQASRPATAPCAWPTSASVPKNKPGYQHSASCTTYLAGRTKL